MAIFKKSMGYNGVEGQRVWTFTQNDCQNNEGFYIKCMKKDVWMYDEDRKFASICKSKCINTNAHTKTTTTHSTPRTRTTDQDGSNSSGYEDDTEQPETEE